MQDATLKPGMTGTEADEIYNVTLALFQGLDRERAWRVRTRFYESGLGIGVCRELLYQHREQVEYLTEPKLIAAIDQARGRDPLTSVKAAAAAAEKRRREEYDRWAADRKTDEERCIALLNELGEDEIVRGHPGAAFVLRQIGLIQRRETAGAA